MNTKKLMWAYMIRHGSTQEWCYYGGAYSLSEEHKRKEHVRILREISRDGVDWDKTKEPEDGFESLFNGTFAESEVVAVLEGTLVTTTGSRYDFGTQLEGARNVFEMFSELGELKFEEELKQKCLHKCEK